MKPIEEVIKEVSKNPITIDMTYKYRNNIELSGYILRKPKFIKHDKTGIESCSLLLYQVNMTVGAVECNSFSCMVYVKDLVDQLKKVDKVMFVATVGKLRYSKRVKGLYSQVLEMQTLCELDIELADEWGKEE